MAEGCLLYYITDRTAFAADEPTRRKRVVDKIAEAVRAGVDYIQLREKDLPGHELEFLAREAVSIIREASKLSAENREPATALLINSRTDIALAVEADGVHLRSDDISAQEVISIWGKCHVGTAALGCPAVRSAAAVEAAASPSPKRPRIGVSCHSPEEVTLAAQAGVTFVVFAPVFEKKDSLGTNPAGLKLLEQACRAPIPVLALGGVNLENAKACFDAGAAGIAAIRVFQEHDVADVASRLRSIWGFRPGMKISSAPP
jgi:thiamine-phosphate pyrophosphorylase